MAKYQVKVSIFVTVEVEAKDYVEAMNKSLDTEEVKNISSIGEFETEVIRAVFNN
jgi:hypothetical protein